MNLFVTMASITFSIINTLFIIFIFLQLKNTTMLQMKQMFECGFTSYSPSIKSFSINYFLMTIIFLIFDMEVLLVMPIMIFKVSMMTAFLLIFLVGYFTLFLVMEWKNNFLEWE